MSKCNLGENCFKLLPTAEDCSCGFKGPAYTNSKSAPSERDYEVCPACASDFENGTMKTLGRNFTAELAAKDARIAELEGDEEMFLAEHAENVRQHTIIEDLRALLAQAAEHLKSISDRGLSGCACRMCLACIHELRDANEELRAAGIK